MANESITRNDMNAATNDEISQTVENVNNKDDLQTTPVEENGYESECSSISRSEEDVAYSALEIEADAYTRFIERQRMDVMFELRRLRLGERPVTGQPYREQIETFINNVTENRQETRAPSTRPAVPSAHLADINALASRRCVSAALTSAGFRQDLENTIRRSIAAQPIPAVVSAAPQIILPSPPAPPSQPVIREQPRQVPVIAEQPRSAPIIPTPRIVPTQPTNLIRQERELDAWDAITQLQREMIVLEISDLVHRQLVSSALESDFRQHLERNVFTRFQRGVPPQTDQPTMPPAPVVPPVPEINANAAQVRPRPLPVAAHNDRASAASIDALTARVDAMQQMLQLMFSMQLDMQRSLRQEVASAMAHHASASPATPPVNAGQCTICLSATADTVLYRCGHLCVCYTCGLQLRQSPSLESIKCPVCRAPVDDILRVYQSSPDAK